MISVDDAPAEIPSDTRRETTTFVRSKASLIQVKEDVSRLISRAARRDHGRDSSGDENEPSSRNKPSKQRNRVRRRRFRSDSRSSSPGNTGSSFASSSPGNAGSSFASSSPGNAGSSFASSSPSNAGSTGAAKREPKVKDGNEKRKVPSDSLERHISSGEREQSSQTSSTVKSKSILAKKSSDAAKARSSMKRRSSVLSSLRAFLERKPHDADEQRTIGHSTLEGNSKQSLEDNSKESLDERTTESPIQPTQTEKHRVSKPTTLSREEVTEMRRTRHKEDSEKSLGKTSGHSGSRRSGRPRQVAGSSYTDRSKKDRRKNVTEPTTVVMRKDSPKTHRSKHASGIGAKETPPHVRRKHRTQVPSDSAHQKGRQPGIIILIEKPAFASDSENEDSRRGQRPSSSRNAIDLGSLHVDKKNRIKKTTRRKLEAHDEKKSNQKGKTHTKGSKRTNKQNVRDKDDSKQAPDGHSLGGVSGRSDDNDSLDPSLLTKVSSHSKVKSISELFYHNEMEKDASNTDNSHSLTSNSLGTRSTISASLRIGPDGAIVGTSKKRGTREPRVGTPKTDERRKQPRIPTTPNTDERNRQRGTQSSPQVRQQRGIASPSSQPKIRSRSNPSPSAEERAQQRHDVVSDLEERNQRPRKDIETSPENRFAWLELPTDDPKQLQLKSANLDGTDPNLEGSSEDLTELLAMNHLDWGIRQTTTDSSPSTETGKHTTHSSETRNMANLQNVSPESSSEFTASEFTNPIRDSLFLKKTPDPWDNPDKIARRAKKQRSKTDRDRSDKETKLPEAADTPDFIVEGDRSKSKKSFSESNSTMNSAKSRSKSEKSFSESNSTMNSAKSRSKSEKSFSESNSTMNSAKSRSRKDRDRDRSDKHREKRVPKAAAAADSPRVSGERTTRSEKEKEKTSGSGPRDESGKRHRRSGDQQHSSPKEISDPPGLRPVKIKAARGSRSGERDGTGRDGAGL